MGIPGAGALVGRGAMVGLPGAGAKVGTMSGDSGQSMSFGMQYSITDGPVLECEWCCSGVVVVCEDKGGVRGVYEPGMGMPGGTTSLQT